MSSLHYCFYYYYSDDVSVVFVVKLKFNHCMSKTLFANSHALISHMIVQYVTFIPSVSFSIIYDYDISYIGMMTILDVALSTIMIT